MASETALSTVAFSVRNWLAVLRVPSTVEEIAAALRDRWHEGVELAEVEEALVELERRGRVVQEGGRYLAVEPRPFHTRPRLTDDEGWEGWA